MGPLTGTKIIELAGIGPAPFCGMMLADMGAEVIRIDRAGAIDRGGVDIASRGKRSIAVNLKDEAGKKIVLDLCGAADGLIEGFRPGVTERLGLGADDCMAVNPRLVYGRMTGWGQAGPMAQAAGHDINYIALAGALHAIGPRGGKPVPPLNLVGDFGGGGMLLAFGVLCALLEAKNSGQGQVVDAAMIDGTAALMAMAFSTLGSGHWNDQRGHNTLDGGAHFYDTYETSDGKYVALGSIEPQFYALLLEKTGLSDDPDFLNQRDPEQWTELKARLTDIFKSKTRDEWCQIMEGSDVCFSPVLSITEVQNHPHHQARNTFIDVDGVIQPAPAPRFNRTGTEQSPSPCTIGDQSESILQELGYDDEQISTLMNNNVVTHNAS